MESGESATARSKDSCVGGDDLWVSRGAALEIYLLSENETENGMEWLLTKDLEEKGSVEDVGDGLYEDGGNCRHEHQGRDGTWREGNKKRDKEEKQREKWYKRWRKTTTQASSEYGVNLRELRK
jgi:hypothetical protein